MQHHANEPRQHGNAARDTEQCRKIRSYGGHVLCAKDTFRWLRIANGVETGRTLTDGIVDDLHAQRMLIVVDASLIVEALFPKFFGLGTSFQYSNQHDVIFFAAAGVSRRITVHVMELGVARKLARCPNVHALRRLIVHYIVLVHIVVEIVVVLVVKRWCHHLWQRARFDRQRGDRFGARVRFDRERYRKHLNKHVRQIQQRKGRLSQDTIFVLIANEGVDDLMVQEVFLLLVLLHCTSPDTVGEETHYHL